MSLFYNFPIDMAARGVYTIFLTKKYLHGTRQK